MKRAIKKLGAALPAALIAALLLLAGCKDLFHPEGPDDDDDYFTITFDADGGSPSTQTRTVTKSGLISSSNMPSEPIKNGAVFIGWYTGRNGGGSQFTSSTPALSNRTVYAKWTAEPTAFTTYELTQNPNHDDFYATPDDFLPDGFSVSAGDRIEISFLIKTDTAMENFGVGIADWANEGDWIATDWDASTSVVADGRFHWRSWTFTAQESGPAGAAPLMIHLTMSSVSKPRVVASISDVTVVNTSLPVCTVTFDADGGSPASQTRTVNSGGSVGSSNMPSEPTKSGGYIFGGWYTSRNGGGSQFDGSTPVSSTRTVYAKWTEGRMYELTKNPDYDNYICNSSDFLPSGFAVGAGGRVTVSFSIKTSAAMTGFYVGIGDWNNGNYYNDSDEAWIAPGWEESQSVPADGQFHSYTWTLTAKSAAPAGSAPLVFHFAMDTTTESKVAVYVKDVSVVKSVQTPSNLTLAESLTWLANNAVEGGDYTIAVRNNETIAPKTLSYSGKTVSVTLDGGASERTVSLSTTGSLFTVGSGVTLTLGNNVALQGRSDNELGNYSSEVVRVQSGGTLVMKDGAKIAGNRSSVYGSGVGIYSGTFIMDGGTISDNYVTSSGGGGAGVYLWPSSNSSKLSAFTMNGGTITNNTAEGRGAGVLANGSEFTMNGGTISNNTAGYGGGVYSANNTYRPYEGASSTVTIEGIFTMNGGIISGNSTISSSGGGVYVASVFTMSGGEISGNSATSSSGGGVYVASNGTFAKQSGGIIYGSNANDTLKNTASSDNNGHAVYVSGSPVKKRNSTAGEGVTLDSSLSGAAGGWEDPMPTTSLQAALAWLNSNAVEGGAYTIALTANETIAPQTLSYSGKNVSVTLNGGTSERTVSLSANGSLFTVGDGVTLTLGNNVALRGRTSNTASLVRVNSGGTLAMNAGSKISGNTNVTTFSSPYGTDGGGVYVNGGAFTMNGGEISGNTISSSFSYGGGALVDSGTLAMNGGTISGNTASYGAGVYARGGGTLAMSGGTISGNTASYGAGVGVADGALAMSGGTISGNIASSYGGGVWVGGSIGGSGALAMEGGEISGNTASSYGGGVYVASNGTFAKQSGGVIYGSNASDTLKNTASSDSYGHAVYVDGSPAKTRNTTAGEGVTLDSETSGAAGGWEEPMPTTSLQAALAWLNSNAVEGGAYTITLTANETIAPQTLSYSGKNVSVTLNGGTSERTVSLSSSGSLFTVGSGVTLTLGNNVALQGRTSNTASLVYVNSGGTLVMNVGSKISGNTRSSGYYGGGVYVNGTLAMNGGEISGNTASYGGGVFVSGGTVTVSGGTISGNSTSSYGGGVFVSGGTVTMSGGAISGNSASSYGGGVFVESNGTITMSGGTVSGNSASTGGGVYVSGSGLFIKQSGGVIYGSNESSATLKNTATSGDSYGHAVYVYVDSSTRKKRNTTAGSGVTLDSAKSGSAGGWE